MTKETREMNSRVRQYRMPGDEWLRKHHWNENKSVERAVAVTTQESSDGIREKAMRIASIDELETGRSTARWFSPGRAEHDRTGKATELVRSLG